MAIDWLGTLFSIGGTLMLLFGLQYGGVSFPWNSVTVICLIVFGISLMILFIVYEWKIVRYPLMPLAIFKPRSNKGVLLLAFLHGYVFIGEFYYLPLYFQAVRGASPLLSGVYVLPSVVATGLAAVATGIYIGATGQYLPPIIIGVFMMTLGFGLFINLDASSSWAKMIIYQLIAGIGVGPNFQAPLVALQNFIHPRDIATGTATFNFLRSLACAMSVIIGQVVFQNQMNKKQPELVASLGPALAAQLGGANAGASSEVIDRLPDYQRSIARSALASSLQPMWIMYACFSALALLSVFLIQRKDLTSEHEIQELGLDAEKRNAAARKTEREEKIMERRR